MSTRDYWIECIYDVIIDMGYSFYDYYTEEEGLNCTDVLPSEDLLSDLEHDINDIIKNLDLDVYLDGRELLCEILDEFQDYAMCFEVIKDEDYATKLVISYLLPEVAWKFTNS
jgi:hypothetical protein